MGVPLLQKATHLPSNEKIHEWLATTKSEHLRFGGLDQLHLVFEALNMTSPGSGASRLEQNLQLFWLIAYEISAWSGIIKDYVGGQRYGIVLVIGCMCVCPFTYDMSPSPLVRRA